MALFLRIRKRVSDLHLRKSHREVSSLQSRLDDGARKQRGADVSKMLDTMVAEKKRLQKSNEQLYKRTVDQDRLIEELQAELRLAKEQASRPSDS